MEGYLYPTVPSRGLNSGWLVQLQRPQTGYFSPHGQQARQDQLDAIEKHTEARMGPRNTARRIAQKLPQFFGFEPTTSRFTCATLQV